MSGLAKAISQVKGQQTEDIASMRLFVINNFPDTIKALGQMDFEYSQAKRRKGFNLVIRETKKYGRRIYVRLSHNGKTLPTKFNTYTGNEKEAEMYIMKNKERLIEGYFARKDGLMYKTFEEYFKEGQYSFSERTRKEYRAIITNKLIPFLRQEKINEFSQITKYTLMKFQDNLRSGLETEKKTYKPLMPQSINNNFKAIRYVFENLARREIIADNLCDLVKGLAVHEKDVKPRGCYELEKINGVFNRKWKDELSYFLCSLIYTTGMRNSEIRKIRLNDIELINGCRYIRIEKSKTVNGIRLIPLHKSLYEKIKVWGIKEEKGQEPLFCCNYGMFNKANNELARRLKVSDKEQERENITFYSGRHYWKTLMSAEGLGEDIEEIWMGHKVSGNAAKLYNHRDKQGRNRMTKKARQVFSILDRCIFNTKP
jgi:integrase